jgi:hypothetical protein
MLPIILFPTIYNLAVCSLGTLNPSEQFSICSTIDFAQQKSVWTLYVDDWNDWTSFEVPFWFIEIPFISIKDRDISMEHIF